MIAANDQKIKTLFEMCDTYSDKKKFENLHSRFEKFADIESIKSLEEIYLPKIV